MANQAVQRVSSVLLDVRHPLWTPVSVGGETPAVTGTATTPGLNGWQPLGVGASDFNQGDATNYVTFRSDAGLMLKLSGGVTGDMIEDHTGDGDASLEMRSHHFEQPGNRTLEFDATLLGRWMERFIYTVFDDTSKRPFDLRETYANKAALSNIMVNNSANYAAGSTDILADGTDLASLEVDDLITFASHTTVYRAVAVSATSITLDKGLTAQVADNEVITRAALVRRVQCPYYISQITDRREAKGVLGMTMELAPRTAPTRTGMS